MTYCLQYFDLADAVCQEGSMEIFRNIHLCTPESLTYSQKFWSDECTGKKLDFSKKKWWIQDLTDSSSDIYTGYDTLRDAIYDTIAEKIRVDGHAEIFHELHVHSLESILDYQTEVKNSKFSSWDEEMELKEADFSSGENFWIRNYRKELESETDSIESEDTFDGYDTLAEVINHVVKLRY